MDHHGKAEADLSWVFGHGAARFERSTCGAMIDRLFAMSRDSEGVRIKTVRDVQDKAWDAEQRRCGKRGEAKSTKEHAVAAVLGDVLKDDAPWINVNPTGGHQPALNYGAVSDEAMQRFARITRAVTRLTMAQVKALEAYYGECGIKWHERAGGNRENALWPHTKAGQKLLADHAKAFLKDGNPDEALYQLSLSHKSRTKGEEVKALLALADKQAAKMKDEALAAYVKEAHGSRH